ncbi:MAG: helical backbone metal receptor [Actinomycetota bacterium]
MKNTKAALLLLALAAALVSCGQGAAGSGEETTARADSGFPVTVTDSLGRKVEIEERPQELGSMAPSVTETIFAVGAGERLEGVTTVDDYPKRVEEIEKIGDFYGVNAEKVASLGIDVLFLSYDTTTRKQAEDLEEKTGADVVVINPTSVEEAIDSVGLVGEIVGNEEKARSVEERLRRKLEQVTAKVEDEPRPTVFYELDYDPLFTVGPGSFVADAIRLAGGKNAAGDAKQPYPQYPVERLVEKDPDYYLVGSGSGVTVEEVKEREAYSTLTAVEEDRVHVVDDDLISRPGPRIVEGVRLIARTIHPDAF